MKLTNEEIARVFAMYLYQKKIFAHIDDMIARTLRGIDRRAIVTDEVGYEFDIDSCKLMLAPLSSITDEHAIETARLIARYGSGIVRKVVTEGNQSVVWFDAITVTIYDDCFSREDAGCPVREMPYEAYQYLIQKGYAVPLFFGPEHWANGKTAIELGIAIPT